MTENLKPQLITTSEIAALAGVDASTVSNWRRRFEATFPQPASADDEGKRPRFDRDEIVEWLRQNPQVGSKRSGSQSVLAQAFDLLRGSVSTESYAELIGQILESIERDRRAGISRSVMTVEEVETLLDTNQIRGAHMPTLFAGQNLLAVYELLRTVADPAAFYDEALAAGINRLSDASDRSTPTPLVDFITALAPSRRGFVIDPVAGFGELLLRCVRDGKGSFGVGVDINVDTVRVANRRFFLAEAEDKVRSEVGDSLNGDVLGVVRGDLVVADPPLGLMFKSESIEWEFGTPKSSNADTAWLQLAVSRLLPEGTAIVVTALGTLFQADRATAQIRNEMVRRGAVQAIFTLPAKLRANTAVRLAVWVLTTPDRPERRSSVLMVDLGADDPKSVDPEGAGIKLFRQWISDEHASLDPTIAVAVPVTDLLAPDATLVPSRWLTSEVESLSASDWIDRVETSREAAEDALSGGFTLPLISGSASLRAPETSTIGELAKRGSVLVLKGRHMERYEGGDESYPILSVREARAPRPDRDSVSDRAEATPGAVSQLVMPGDVLVYPDGDDVVARVWSESGWLLGRFMQAIRVLDDSWNAHYIAAAINSPANSRHLLGGISRTHFNLLDFTVAVQGASDQQIAQSIDESLERLATRLTESAEAVRKAKREILNALASGLVTTPVESAPVSSEPRTTS
jgi:hypothetical protein